MKKYAPYSLFADLLRYPSGDFDRISSQCLAWLEATCPEAAEEYRLFHDYMLTRSQDQREELYTKTFDVQPICYLDLGYVIFGEDYKRGAFLLHMQGEQQRAGNDCGTDLPDNISNMLTLYGLSENQGFLDELSVNIMIPGIEKMIAEFRQARIDLKVKVLKKMHRAIIQEELNTGNVYRNLFAALLAVMKTDFAGVQKNEMPSAIANPDYHSTFFKKNSVNEEVNNLVSNYKLD